MKFCFVILTSLLVIDLYSVTAADVPDTRSQNTTISADPEDAASQKQQKCVCPILDTVEEIRGFLGNKWKQVQLLLRGNGADVMKPVNYEEQTIFSENELYVGHFLANYTLAYLEYDNIRAVGLKEFKKTEVHLDPRNTAKLIVKAPSLRIFGNYTLFNKLKRASGLFEVILSQITYTETSQIHRLSNSEVDILVSDTSFQYSKLKAEYKDIGFFTKFLSGSIGGKLVNRVVLPLLAKVTGAAGRTIYLRELRQLASIAGRAKAESRLEDIINTALSEARQLLKKGGYSYISLSDPTIEFPYNGQTIKVVELNVSGLCTFELKNKSILIQNNSLFVDLEVKTSEVNTSTVVDIGGADNPSLLPPIWFKSNYIVANISFEKELNKDDAWFRVVKVVVQIDKLEPLDNDDQGVPERHELVYTELPRILAEEINKRLADLAKAAIGSSISDASNDGLLQERISF